MTLYELYKTRDPEHPMIRAHRLALAGRSVTFELEQEGRLDEAMSAYEKAFAKAPGEDRRVKFMEWAARGAG
mgnify:CR=1 FL=1